MTCIDDLTNLWVTSTMNRTETKEECSEKCEEKCEEQVATR
jgi:hypothetical protein